MNPFTAPRARARFAAMALLLLTAAGAALRGQNAAPPPPVPWPTPALPDGPILLQSAEVRDFRVTVLSRTLEQPWSLAFLPNGDMLVTERPGRIRIFHNGVLDPAPVAGAPKVRAVVSTGRTLVNGQPELAGESTLARGVWDGKAITNLTDIFATGATVTESSRIAFGRDGMLYMTVSAPGTGPQVVRSQDPSDYAGTVIRLRDDGSVPPDNPFVGRPGFKPAIYTRSAFAGGLREGEVPRSGQLQRVVFNERWEEIRREPLLRELKQRIRDVRQGPDGLLYVLTGENPGAVLRLEPVGTAATQ